MDQVGIADTGVLTRELLEELRGLDCAIPILADSRRGLRGYPPCIFKMNAAELATLTGCEADASLAAISRAASQLAVENQRPVFVTLAERGIIGSSQDGCAGHIPAVPLRGPIDVVGAGDSVTANLAAALAAGASMGEAMELAALASSVVLHQLGTSGAASIRDIGALLADPE
jgi:bifunctional ADP-heptose synthase (sugar kinase/adenylyltransferase)